MRIYGYITNPLMFFVVACSSKSSTWPAGKSFGNAVREFLLDGLQARKLFVRILELTLIIGSAGVLDLRFHRRVGLKGVE